MNKWMRYSRKDRCTACGGTSHTWTYWPWPDGASLCEKCNDDRHEEDDFSEIELKSRYR